MTCVGSSSDRHHGGHKSQNIFDSSRDDGDLIEHGHNGLIFGDVLIRDFAIAVLQIKT